MLLFLICVLSHVLLDTCTDLSDPASPPLAITVWPSTTFSSSIRSSRSHCSSAPAIAYCVQMLADDSLSVGPPSFLAVSDMGMTFANKYVAQQVFVASLAEQGIETKSLHDLPPRP